MLLLSVKKLTPMTSSKVTLAFSGRINPSLSIFSNISAKSAEIKTNNHCLYNVIYLFVLGFSFNRDFFSHMEMSPFTGEGLQIFTFARHAWPMSTEGSLMCHTYCDIGHLNIMVISKDLWHSPCYIDFGGETFFNMSSFLMDCIGFYATLEAFQPSYM